MALSDPTSGAGYSFGQVLPSSHMTTIANQQVRALDAVNGGTWTATGVMAIQGAGTFSVNHLLLLSGGSSQVSHNVSIDTGKTITWSGTSNLPQLGSRSYTRVIPIEPFANENARWAY